jgi:hypothetical protein
VLWGVHVARRVVTWLHVDDRTEVGEFRVWEVWKSVELSPTDQPDYCGKSVLWFAEDAKALLNFQLPIPGIPYSIRDIQTVAECSFLCMARLARFAALAVRHYVTQRGDRRHLTSLGDDVTRPISN